MDRCLLWCLASTSLSSLENILPTVETQRLGWEYIGPQLGESDAPGSWWHREPTRPTVHPEQRQWLCLVSRDSGGGLSISCSSGSALVVTW